MKAVIAGFLALCAFQAALAIDNVGVAGTYLMDLNGRNAVTHAQVPIAVGACQALNAVWEANIGSFPGFTDGQAVVFDAAGDMYWKTWHGTVVKMSHVDGSRPWE